MTKEITQTDSNFSLSKVSSFEEALKVAELMSKSGMVPSCYRGKPSDVLICIDYGKGLGFDPLQSLQSIAVINGTPSIYGDGMLAIVRNHPEYAGIQEEVKNDVATCTVKRVGRHGTEESTTQFSKQNAQKAGLWGKKGPWSDYPERMLKMRARGFALRDMFADVIKGLKIAEEVMDYNIVSNSKNNDSAKEKLADLVSPKTTIKSVNAVHEEDKKKCVENFEEAEYHLVDDELFKADVTTLEQIVKEKNLPNETVQEWMEKGNASSFDELKHKTIKALIKKYGN